MTQVLTLSLRDSGHPEEEIQLYPPEEGRNVDQPVNHELLVLADPPPLVHPSLPPFFPLIRERNRQILTLLHLGQDLVPDPEETLPFSGSRSLFRKC